jgi:site-specific DNA-methyltransferase (adenine-specific)
MQLIHGDCLEKMKDIPDKSIDMILCDLPYGTTYADFDTVLKNGQSMKCSSVIPLPPLWEQYKRVIKNNGAIVLFGSQPFTSILISSNIEMYKYSWVWEKNKAANHVAVKFQPLKVHEDIIIFSFAGVNTGASVPINYYPQGVLWGEQTKIRKNDIRKEGTFRYNSLKKGEYTIKGTNYPLSILPYDIPTDRLHPTQKPVALLEYLIKTYTLEGETVLDNCMGSGSTGIACINTNRNFIGIEKDDKYFEIAKKRIEDHLTTAST